MIWWRRAIFFFQHLANLCQLVAALSTLWAQILAARRGRESAVWQALLTLAAHLHFVEPEFLYASTVTG